MTQSNELATRQKPDATEIMEHVLLSGDLSELQPAERINYYRSVCESVGLNPLTKPFEYLYLGDGEKKKLTLYAKRDATDQLRKIHGVKVTITDRQTVEGVYVVTAKAETSDGRSDESTGAVALVKEDGQWKTSQSGKRYLEKNGKLIPLSPDERANAMMKAETKAKRRVTLSICGLGLLDESELETIPTKGKKQSRVDLETGELVDAGETDLSVDAEFLSVWDSIVEGKQLDQKTGRGVLGAICKKRGIDFFGADVPVRQKLIDDFRAATPEQIDKIRQAAAKTNGNGAAAPATQQQPAAEEAKELPPEPPVTDELVKAWEGFFDQAWESAARRGVDLDAFSAGINKLLVLLGKKGKESSVSVAQKKKVLQAIRDGAFDFATGQVNQVEAALA